jgi:hypothetical protein
MYSYYAYMNYRYMMYHISSLLCSYTDSDAEIITQNEIEQSTFNPFLIRVAFANICFLICWLHNTEMYGKISGIEGNSLELRLA